VNKYKAFYFRAPDVQTFLQDVLTVALDNGLDPRETGEIIERDDGTLEAGGGIDAIPAGRWWLTEPEFDYSTDPPTKTQEGVLGDYALINVLTKRDDLIELIGQFAASDPSKQPSEIPDSEKIGSGTHRIDGSMLSSPARTW